MYKFKKGKPFAAILTYCTYTINIPKNMEKSHLKWFWFKYTLLKLFCILVAIVQPILHAVMSIKNKTGIDISEDISISTGIIGALSVGFLFTGKFKKWMDFFNEVTFFDDVAVSSIILEKHVKRFNLYTIMTCMFSLVGSVIWAIIHFVQIPKCKRLNQERNLHEFCGTYSHVWLPFFNNDNLAIVIIISIAQSLVCLTVLSAAAILSILMWELTEVLGVHINILRECFLCLFEGTGEISDKLRFCINYHVRILSMASRLNILLKYTVSHMAFLSAMAMGFILNQMIESGDSSASFYLIGYTTATFIICHAGETIKNETLSIGDGICASNWQRADPKTMRDLAFIISRCQKPVYFEALPLGVLDYPLFIMILKTAYSYLTLVNDNM